MLVRQLDNIRVVAATELANKRHSAVDALEKGAWPHRSANLETAEIVGNVEKSVFELNARHIFADINCVGFSPFTITHVQTLPRSNTERDEFETQGNKFRKFNSRLTISHVQSIGRIGAASPCARGDEPNRRPNHSRPANDNPVNDDWSPLEAA